MKLLLHINIQCKMLTPLALYLKVYLPTYALSLPDKQKPVTCIIAHFIF